MGWNSVSRSRVLCTNGWEAGHGRGPGERGGAAKVFAIAAPTEQLDRFPRDRPGNSCICDGVVKSLSFSWREGNVSLLQINPLE